MTAEELSERLAELVQMAQDAGLDDDEIETELQTILDVLKGE
jgi:hypothetical protein